MVTLSEIDRERFGIVTARDPSVTAASLAATLDFCRANAVRLLIARCDATDLGAAQAIEAAGGRLMDTLVHYRHDLARIPAVERSPALVVRPFRPEEVDSIRTIAAESFKGYLGHYHADPRLDRVKCDETYADWAYRSCTSRAVAADVLVGVLGGAVAGFATLRINDGAEAEVALNAVSPAAQRQGVYSAILAHALEWARARGCRRLVISTQVTNAVQRAWVRLGFEPSHATYTFHAWFDG